jgi:predicted DNA-binding transcriptional regulator AlpA
MPVEPLFYPPRGLSRDDAARYLGLGATLFDQLVADGRLPQPRKVNTRVVWDRHELDLAFADLPRRDEKTKGQLALERLEKS